MSRTCLHPRHPESERIPDGFEGLTQPSGGRRNPPLELNLTRTVEEGGPNRRTSVAAGFYKHTHRLSIEKAEREERTFGTGGSVCSFVFVPISLRSGDAPQSPRDGGGVRVRKTEAGRPRCHPPTASTHRFTNLSPLGRYGVNLPRRS